MISEVRRQIDVIDKKIVSLISDRMRLSERIALEKQKSSIEITDKARESIVLQKVSEQAEGSGIAPGFVRSIFRSLISYSKGVQDSLRDKEKKEVPRTGQRIAVLGPEGTFSEAAAIESFPDAKLIYFNYIRDVFSAVATQDCDLAVVPVENSVEGSVSETLDCLLDFPIFVCKEIILPVEHALFLSKGTALDKVKRIFVHPQAAAQCREFLSANLKDAELVPCASSSSACDMASKERGSAAIGSLSCGRLYGLSLCFSGMQDSMENRTRFLVLGKELSCVGKGSKTSIILSLKNVPGSLHKALGYFSEKEIDLTKIESRPVKDDFGSYIFYIDLLGALGDPVVDSALSALEADSKFLKRLGSYQISK